PAYFAQARFDSIGNAAKSRLDRLANLLEQALQEIPARVRIAQRVVLHVAVAVEGLQIGGVLDKRIGTEEPAYLRIIHPPAHMDKVDAIELVVPCKALVGGGAGQGQSRDGEVALLVIIQAAPVAEDALQLGQSGRSSLAPRIKAEGFHLVA